MFKLWNTLKHRLRERAPAESSMAMFFVIIGIFIFVLVAYASLTISMLMSHQHEMDDILADSVLAACIGDKEYYFDTRENASGGVIRFGVGGDIKQCQDAFASCLNAEVSEGYNKFFNNLKVEDLIFYEVDGDTITIISYDQLADGSFVGNEAFGTVGAIKTPGKDLVKRTSVYARISFDVHAYFMFDITQNVSRELYSTIKIDDASVHQGQGYYN